MFTTHTYEEKMHSQNEMNTFDLLLIFVQVTCKQAEVVHTVGSCVNDMFLSHPDDLETTKHSKCLKYTNLQATYTSMPDWVINSSIY